MGYTCRFYLREKTEKAIDRLTFLEKAAKNAKKNIREVLRLVKSKEYKHADLDKQPEVLEAMLKELNDALWRMNDLLSADGPWAKQNIESARREVQKGLAEGHVVTEIVKVIKEEEALNGQETPALPGEVGTSD